ncbi:MAG: ABC transporter ATP-binding protein [Myxococcota bacterium]
MSAPADDAVLRVDQLVKTYRVGFWRKKVEAVRGVSFDVRRGEIFGLLGPNGAGKTTTIKTLLGLCFPTAGTLRIFGGDPADPKVRARLGYMPENPYVYRYLRPPEFLDLCGRLFGMDGKARRDAIPAMIETVGLTHAADRPIGKFSKGMMQRVGLAQTLLHDPDLLILDEPMSGLDPVGRKEIRDILLAQKKAGKTLVFTSHILSDVEMLCDRAVILRRGKVVAEGAMSDLLGAAEGRTEIELAEASAELRARLAGREGSRAVHEGSASLFVDVAPEAVDATLREALEGGARVVAVRPERRSLESFFTENEAPPTGNDAPPPSDAGATT